MLICVPTPLGEGRSPDLSYVIGTGRSIAPNLCRGMLVVLESTTYPGTTDTELREVSGWGSREYRDPARLLEGDRDIALLGNEDEK